MLPYFRNLSRKCTHLELLPVELGMDSGNAEKIFHTWQTKKQQKNCRISHPRARDMEQNGNTKEGREKSEK